MGSGAPHETVAPVEGVAVLVFIIARSGDSEASVDTIGCDVKPEAGVHRLENCLISFFNSRSRSESVSPSMREREPSGPLETAGGRGGALSV